MTFRQDAIKQPRVTLVGAGPGDPELITLKGLKAIQGADVILYDALISKDLLDMASPYAILKYVGKRSGQHSMQQADINQLIVDMAQAHGHVVRLKGGDPFIFGRGKEEQLYAEACDIPVEVIPGLSSALSLATLQHISLTHRGISNSIHIVTGTTSEGHISPDLLHIAQGNGTCVILMGVHKIEGICSLFISAGKGEMPGMVIQNGSLPNQRQVSGPIKDLPILTTHAGIGAPAIILLGHVVELYHANPCSTLEGIIPSTLSF